MKIEIKNLRTKQFSALEPGDVFMCGVNFYIKTKGSSDLNTVNLSTGNLSWTGYDVPVLVQPDATISVSI